MNLFRSKLRYTYRVVFMKGNIYVYLILGIDELGVSNLNLEE